MFGILDLRRLPAPCILRVRSDLRGKQRKRGFEPRRTRRARRAARRNRLQGILLSCTNRVAAAGRAGPSCLIRYSLFNCSLSPIVHWLSYDHWHGLSSVISSPGRTKARGISSRGDAGAQGREDVSIADWRSRPRIGVRGDGIADLASEAAETEDGGRKPAGRVGSQPTRAVVSSMKRVSSAL